MLTALLVFPCSAILWMLICDRLGFVRDEPLIVYASGAAALGDALSVAAHRRAAPVTGD